MRLPTLRWMRLRGGGDVNASSRGLSSHIEGVGGQDSTMRREDFVIKRRIKIGIVESYGSP